MKHTVSIMFMFVAFAGLAGEPPQKEDVKPPPTNKEPADNENAPGKQEFRLGNKLMGEKKYVEALAAYTAGVEKAPKIPILLYNAGMAAFLSRNYTAATEFWGRLKELDPEDWKVRAKLVQAWQALGKTAERDAERAGLFKLHETTKDEKFKATPSYCREQFEASGKKIMVFEHFRLEGEQAVRYSFAVLKPDKDEEDYDISLGSYETTTAIMREYGELKKDERAFHLDGYYDQGRTHKTYGIYTKEPTYDETRKMVVEILSGKREAESSSKVKADNSVDVELK